MGFPQGESWLYTENYLKKQAAPCNSISYNESWMTKEPGRTRVKVNRWSLLNYVLPKATEFYSRNLTDANTCLTSLVCFALRSVRLLRCSFDSTPVKTADVVTGDQVAHQYSTAVERPRYGCFRVNWKLLQRKSKLNEAVCTIWWSIAFDFGNMTISQKNKKIMLDRLTHCAVILS